MEDNIREVYPEWNKKEKKVEWIDELVQPLQDS
jgi:hypothetical protein